MNWLSANWVWILIAVAIVSMHMFGHGGHGCHGGRGKSRERLPKRPADEPAGHRWIRSP